MNTFNLESQDFLNFIWVYGVLNSFDDHADASAALQLERIKVFFSGFESVRENAKIAFLSSLNLSFVYITSSYHDYLQIVAD